MSRGDEKLTARIEMCGDKEGDLTCILMKGHEAHHTDGKMFWTIDQKVQRAVDEVKKTTTFNAKDERLAVGDRVALRCDFFEVLGDPRYGIPAGAEGVVTAVDEVFAGHIRVAWVSVRFFREQVIMKVHEALLTKLNLAGKIDLQEEMRKQQSQAPQFIGDPYLMDLKNRAEELRNIKAQFVRIVRAAFRGDVSSVMGEVTHMLTRRDKELVKQAFNEVFEKHEQPGETLKVPLL